nr:probably inactive leucine-rich repeat receptor-like protein kinase IMK2 [Ipomoea batatas]
MRRGKRDGADNFRQVPGRAAAAVAPFGFERERVVGELPYDMPASLCYLSISVNQMWGPLNGLESLSDLVYLDLSMNHFDRPIPPNFFRPSLASIFLQRNKFSGGVNNHQSPPILPYGPGSVLDLSHNSLTGEIPTALARAESVFSNNNRFVEIVLPEYFQSVYSSVTKTLWNLNLNPSQLLALILDFLFHLQVFRILFSIDLAALHDIKSYLTKILTVDFFTSWDFASPAIDPYFRQVPGRAAAAVAPFGFERERVVGELPFSVPRPQHEPFRSAHPSQLLPPFSRIRFSSTEQVLRWGQQPPVPPILPYGPGSVLDLSHNSLTSEIPAALARAESVFRNNNRFVEIVLPEYFQSVYNSVTKTLFLRSAIGGDNRLGDLLRELKCCFNVPWVVIGDFNDDIASHSEKRGSILTRMG